MVPPFTLTLPLPLFPPLHNTLVEVEPDATKVFGWVTVMLAVCVAPLLSITVTLYVPAVKLLILDVVAPLLHE